MSLPIYDILFDMHGSHHFFVCAINAFSIFECGDKIGMTMSVLFLK